MALGAAGCVETFQLYGLNCTITRSSGRPTLLGFVLWCCFPVVLMFCGDVFAI